MTELKDFKIKIYSDGANIDDMRHDAQYDFVSGFTTNPSLMKAAGVTDYLTFAKQVVSELGDYDISFEVFGQDDDTMLKEAEILTKLGDKVFVKIPIITTDGKSTAPLIKKLSAADVALNVTAITTLDQVKEASEAFKPGSRNIVSVFAGRVADTGADPIPLMKESLAITQQYSGTELLWASTREVFNIVEAERLGVDIITVPPTILKKLESFGKSAQDVSLDTVKGFEKDIQASGLSIL